MEIAKDKVVGIDYKLTDEDGQVLDTSEGGEPLYYLHGTGAIIVGLEGSLEGKRTGDQLQVTVSPADGYGERNEELEQQVPREHFEGVDDLEVGMQFRVPTDDEEDDEYLVVTVVEIEEDVVTIDGNHALAGLTLNFDVTVREVRDATEEELEHGHVHGPGGHEHG